MADYFEHDYPCKKFFTRRCVDINFEHGTVMDREGVCPGYCHRYDLDMDGNPL